MGMIWTVYALYDPRTGSPRYVGCTKQALDKRWSEHLNPLQTDRSKKADWIRKLRTLGLRPTTGVLASSSMRHEALRFELEWMRRLSDLGFDLCNQVNNRGDSVASFATEFYS